jgi:hypothetical protein
MRQSRDYDANGPTDLSLPVIDQGGVYHDQAIGMFGRGGVEVRRGNNRAGVVHVGSHGLSKGC